MTAPIADSATQESPFPPSFPSVTVVGTITYLCSDPVNIIMPGVFDKKRFDSENLDN
jgi:hypothetical protein